MKIHTYPLGEMMANCYVVEKDNACIIIDPSDSADFILGELHRLKLNCLGLIATHGHFDHIMAVGEIQMSIDVPFYIHKDDLFLVERLNKTAKYYLGYDPNVLLPQKINFLMPDNFLLNTFNFKLVDTPGHTPGGCCFYNESGNILFSGDTLFKQGIGRYDFSYSNKEKLFNSIATILKLPKNTIVYPGHGIATTVDNEKSAIS